MSVSPLQVRLSQGRPAVGAWSIVASPTLVEIAAKAGLDFVILDLEHGAWDFGRLEDAVRAAEGGGAAPLVRVPDLSPATFQRVLDLGAHGVVVPQVRSAGDAELAVRCARYAPRGMRGYNPFTRAADYAAPAARGEGKLADAFGLVCVIVENETAYADLDAICAVEGLDAVYLGVYDMSLALGCDGDVTHPRVQAFVDDATRRILAAGKAVGAMVRSAEALDKALAAGVRLLVWDVDSHLAYRAFRTPVEALQAQAPPQGAPR